MHELKYSLVIPCYNEAKNLPHLIERCKELLARKVEVILVDNGSSDGSLEIMQEHKSSGIRIVQVVKNQGYGYGILEGLRVAHGDVIGWTHADLQTDPNDFLKALPLFAEHGPDIFVKGQRSGRPLADTFFTTGMSIFETCLLRRRLWDINAQPTLFAKTFFNKWQADAPHDFALDLFAYYQARELGVKVKRIPVLFGKRLHGVSHWNVDWAAKKKFIKRTVDFSLALRSSLK